MERQNALHRAKWEMEDELKANKIEVDTELRLVKCGGETLYLHPHMEKEKCKAAFRIFIKKNEQMKKISTEFERTISQDLLF